MHGLFRPRAAILSVANAVGSCRLITNIGPTTVTYRLSDPPRPLAQFEPVEPTGLLDVKVKLEEPASYHQRRCRRHRIAPVRRFVDAALTASRLERPAGVRSTAGPDLGLQPVHGSGHQR